MHELSIAQSLIDVACEAAEREGANRVTRLTARIGVLSGVVKECLLFSFGLAAEGTPCAGAVLDVEEVGITVMCPHCESAQALGADLTFRCPRCGTPTPEILTGRELELVSLEVAAHATADC